MRTAENIYPFQPSFGTAVIQCCGLKPRMSLMDNDVLEKLNTFGREIP